MDVAGESNAAMADDALASGHLLERALLMLQQPPSQSSQSSSTLSSTIASLVKGDLAAVLESAGGKQLILHPATSDDASLLQSFVGIASDAVVQQERQLSALFIGAAALLAFMQCNWTGPDLPESLRTELDAFPLDRKTVISQLERDGETVYTEVSYPQLLLGALRIFCSGQHFNRSTSHTWWTARAIMTQQRILSGRCESLQTKIYDMYGKAWKHFSPSADQELLPRLLLEWVVAHTYYGEHGKAREKLLAAQAASGFQIKLTGALGVRTKHQTFLTAQLRVDAKSAEPTTTTITASAAPAGPATPGGGEEKSTAKDMPLNDADLLEAVRFAGNVEDANLKVIDQAILLAFCLDIRHNNAKDYMTTEEMAAFVNRALANPNNWMVHSTALLLRSRIEKEKFRTADRAVLQLQQLVEQWNDTDAPVHHRLPYIFCLGFPVRWELKRELGDGFIELGAAASALAIFEELQMWDDIIRCYQIMQKNAKAEEVVRERLKVAPTPHLHCLLGELTGDHSHFETSWELSGHHYARAQRQWAFQLARAAKWAECIPHFELALAINPLYQGAWFTYGCAAMNVSEWPKAAKAFARVVQLEPEEFEAWANLGSVYVKMDKKEMAYHALMEAVRQNYESWRVWQNLLYVSMDTGQLATAIQALVRIAELQPARLECDIIGMLVDALSKEESSSALYRSFSDALAKISTLTSVPAFWGVYADWYARTSAFAQAYEMRQREMRALQVVDWERDPVAVKAVLATCEPLTEVAIREANVSHLYATVLSLRGVMRKTQELYSDNPDFRKLESLIASLKEAEQKVRAAASAPKP